MQIIQISFLVTYTKLLDIAYTSVTFSVQCFQIVIRSLGCSKECMDLNWMENLYNDISYTVIHYRRPILQSILLSTNELFVHLKLCHYVY